MKSFLEFILKGIVKNPQDVTVVEFNEGEEVVYEIIVNPNDVGQIIGKDGRTIKSINTLLNAAKETEGKKFVLKVIR